MAPPKTLEGKVAIVTGGSRGIGYSIVQDLVSRGAKVVTTYSSDRSAKAVAALKTELGTDAIHGVQCDLSKPESPAHIVSETTEVFGPHIDILVNNAALLAPRSLADVTAAQFDETYHINVRAPLLMTQAVLPHLRRPGRIIHVSSVGARFGMDEVLLYSSSKSALEGLTRCMAWELGKDGTTVNAVAPGPVRSEMLDQIPQKEVDRQAAATAVQRRVGTPEEVAEVVGFLAEERSSWVTGQVINASGGFTMY